MHFTVLILAEKPPFLYIHAVSINPFASAASVFISQPPYCILYHNFPTMNIFNQPPHPIPHPSQLFWGLDRLIILNFFKDEEQRGNLEPWIIIPFNFGVWTSNLKYRHYFKCCKQHLKSRVRDFCWRSNFMINTVQKIQLDWEVIPCLRLNNTLNK